MHVRDGYQAVRNGRWTWGLALLLVITVVLFNLVQRNQDQPGPPGVAVETLPTAAVVSPVVQTLNSHAGEVSAVGGRLSIHVENRSLEWILDRITREAEVAIIMNGNLADVFVSDQFSDLPLEDGLQRLLANEDTFFFHTGGALRVVWVYPATQGRGIVPTPPEEWASTRDLENLLTHEDPDTRGQALEAVVERKGDEALEDVLWAMLDKDDSVRTAAIYAALGEIDIPPDMLANLASNDPSISVRYLALESLVNANDPGLKTIAQTALGDESSHIRSKAREILDQLQRATELEDKPSPVSRQQLPPG